MNNSRFINHLQNISNDRFATDHLSDGDYRAFLATLLACFGHTPAPNTWYLVGTAGCHLCDEACLLIHTALPHQPLINLDLVDAPPLVLDALGRRIPVLLTPSRLLCCPFGIMDIVQLLS